MSWGLSFTEIRREETQTSRRNVKITQEMQIFSTSADFKELIWLYPRNRKKSSHLSEAHQAYKSTLGGFHVPNDPAWEVKSLANMKAWKKKHLFLRSMNKPSSWFLGKVMYYACSNCVTATVQNPSLPLDGIKTQQKVIPSLYRLSCAVLYRSCEGFIWNESRNLWYCVPFLCIMQYLGVTE